MLDNFIPNLLESKKSTENQLRPLIFLFKIQFGQDLRFQGKLVKNWIKNTKSFKRRRKTGLVKPPHPKYHYKRGISSLKFYKFMFLKHKTFNLLKINLFSGNFQWLNKEFKIKFELKKKIAFFKKRLAKKGSLHLKRGIRKARRKIFEDFMFVNKYTPKYNRTGRLYFVNSWINFFHKFNLKRLRTTKSKLNFYTSGLVKFTNSWQTIFTQNIFCIYLLFSFYLFRSVFIKENTKDHRFFFNKTLICLVSISYKEFSFLMNLLYILKFSFNQNIYNLYSKYLKSNFISSIKKKKQVFFFDFLKTAQENLKNKLKEVKKPKKFFKIKILNSKEAKRLSYLKARNKRKKNKKEFNFKNTLLFCIFSSYLEYPRIFQNNLSHSLFLKTFVQKVFFKLICLDTKYQNILEENSSNIQKNQNSFDNIFVSSLLDKYELLERPKSEIELEKEELEKEELYKEYLYRKYLDEEDSDKEDLNKELLSKNYFVESNKENVIEDLVEFCSPSKFNEAKNFKFLKFLKKIISKFSKNIFFENLETNNKNLLNLSFLLYKNHKYNDFKKNSILFLVFKQNLNKFCLKTKNNIEFFLKSLYLWFLDRKSVV